MIAKLGGFTQFLGAVLTALVTRPRYLMETVRLMQVIAMRCIIPVSLAVAPVGAVISLQGVQIFQMFGAERLLSSFLGMAIFREYSPAPVSYTHLTLPTICSV